MQNPIPFYKNYKLNISALVCVFKSRKLLINEFPLWDKKFSFLKHFFFAHSYDNAGKCFVSEWPNEQKLCFLGNSNLTCHSTPLELRLVSEQTNFTQRPFLKEMLLHSILSRRWLKINSLKTAIGRKGKITFIY